jgi:hypothetical protein
LTLVFACIVVGAIIHLLWKLARERTMERMSAFAATLPEDERAIFWRLHQERDLWNASRYPKAFRKWKKRQAEQQQQPRVV